MIIIWSEELTKLHQNRIRNRVVFKVNVDLKMIDFQELIASNVVWIWMVGHLMSREQCGQTLEYKVAQKLP